MSFDSEGFWGERWAAGQIGFHQAHVHPALVGEEGRFLAGGPHRVLVPLSGKSWDVPWFADQGHEVTAVEIVRQAVDEMFAEHRRTATIEERRGFEVHTAERIEVYRADFFALPPEIGPFTRVWDRAAIVAVPPERRPDYAAQLGALAPGALVWLMSLDYDPGALTGPPHAVPVEEIERLFAEASPQVLERVDLAQDPTSRWSQRGIRRFEATLWSMTLPS